jgi:hypothetical protein
MVTPLPATQHQQLTKLERAALQRAISKVEVIQWRDALTKQIDALHVTNRTERTAGYYADFEVPLPLRIDNLPDEFNKNPPQIEARHPDGSNGIFFVVYVKGGMLSFMEAASTADWPKDEDRIIFGN